jgi:hypothetical protein
MIQEGKRTRTFKKVMETHNKEAVKWMMNFMEKSGENICR